MFGVGLTLNNEGRAFTVGDNVPFLMIGVEQVPRDYTLVTESRDHSSDMSVKTARQRKAKTVEVV